MMKLKNGVGNYRLSIVIFVAIGSLLFLRPLLNACASGYDYIQTILTPEAYIDAKFSDFFYDPFNSYYKKFNEPTGNLFDLDVISKWQEYLKITSGETQNFVMKSTLSDIHRYRNSGYNDLEKKYNKVNNLKEVLEYLNYAKMCEGFSYSSDAWSTDNLGKVPIDIMKIEEEMVKKISSAQDIFLKERYWFQVIRMRYFLNTDANLIFTKFESQMPKTTIYYRAMSYAAGSLMKNGQIAKANYMYSLVFENNDILKPVAHISIKPKDNAIWNQTLRLTKSNKEKITLWLMIGLMYQDEMNSMEEIYKLDPIHPYLAVLAVNKANRLEDHDVIVLSEWKLFQDFILKVISNPQTPKIYIWNELASYTYYIQDDFSKANTYLKNAEKTLPNQELSRNQLMVLETLYNVMSQKTANALNVSQVMHNYSVIKKLSGNNFLSGYYNDNSGVRLDEFISKVRRHYSDLYYKSGNVPYAVAFVNNDSIYQDTHNIRTIYKFLTKSDKSEYERFIEEIYTYKLKDYRMYYSSEAILRNNDLLVAKMHFSQLGKEEDDTLQGNPFNGNIMDCNDCDHMRRMKNPYTCGSLLDKMILMKSKIEAKEDVYNNALLLGNAFYNITHYGNARSFTENNITGYFYTGYGIPKNSREIILNMKWAKYYYGVALANTTEEEQKAKLYYLLSKCERNEYYAKEFYSVYMSEWMNQDKAPADFIMFDNYKNLFKYSQTNYFQEVLRECGYVNKAWKNRNSK